MKEYLVERTTPEEYQCKTAWCKFYNHWANPFGNWIEPLPFPKKRADQAVKSFLPGWLYWTLRNPLHNFMSHYIGIIPIGPRYAWIRPEENGWKLVEKSETLSFWVKDKFHIPLPFYNHNGRWTFYIGWTKRGNFGVAIRKNGNYVEPTVTE